MMSQQMKLEVFFDYACPYCLRAHEHLIALLPQHPQIEVVWRPCESHPRPDPYGIKSDLCIQGMFYAMEHGVDMWAYHELVYNAALKNRVNIEDLDTLTSALQQLVDGDDFRKTIKSGKYVPQLQAANRYAFQQSGVWAVPAYRLNGNKLDAIEDIGVTKNQLDAFLSSVKSPK